MEEMMQHRVTVLSSAFVMACLLALGLAPATAAQQDVCISYDGQEIYQYGSADCDSEQGGNSAIAVGDGAIATLLRVAVRTAVLVDLLAVIADADILLGGGGGRES